ncbi:MAG: endonuclease III domain-containing protein [Nitrospirota bacterium]
MEVKTEKLVEIYRELFHAFGPQHWWPGETPFEIALGAILTQNTNWGNVERAIENLKKGEALKARAIYGMPAGKLALLIMPAGYFNIKAKRIKAFISFLMSEYQGSMEKLKGEGLKILRSKLLKVNGIGPETADSILLYALNKPVFVIDTYTKRVLSRHNIMDYNESYERFQELFHSSLKRSVRLFNEYHALLVRVGKAFCRTRPLCKECPLEGV